MIRPVSEDDRAFAFARIMMGDELSKRAKFVLITWSGANVGGIKRAKMSTDKSLVKNVIRVSLTGRSLVKNVMRVSLTGQKPSQKRH